MKLYLIYILFGLLSYTQVYSQDYYKEIHKAEEFIINNELEKATFQYKKTFEKYNYPFSRDLLAATCISQKIKDKSTFYQFLKIALKFGLNKTELQYFINHSPNDTILLNISAKYDEFEKSYLNKIDYDFNNRFLNLDKNDQIRIHLFNSKLNTNSPEKYNIDKDFLVNQYITLVTKYGFPSDKNCGSSVSKSTLFTNEGLPNYINEKDYIIEHIITPDIRVHNDDSVYFTLSFKKNRFINSLTHRPGNSLLWHLNIKRYPSLDSLLIEGIEQLKIYPSLYAACLERYDIDYLIGMGGANSIWRKELKFNINNVNKLDSKTKTAINKRRTAIGIRSIENELALHKAIIKLEGLKEKDFTKIKRRNPNLLYYSLFNSAMP